MHNLRLYVEFPSWIPQGITTSPVRAVRERGVVAGAQFAPEVDPLTILAIHDCRYLQAESNSPWIALAKVAGFDTAVYGMPDDNHPILFEALKGRLLVATTKLSQMVRGRYAPVYAWEKVWGVILAWLTAQSSSPPLPFEPEVRPSHGRAHEGVDEGDAVKRSIGWYRSAGLLIHDDWKDELANAARWEDHVAPGPGMDWKLGDGHLGILEGHSSSVMHDGTQHVRWYTRADCTCESAMAFALADRMDASENSGEVARNLLQYVYEYSDIQQGPRADSESPSFGLLGWDTRPEGLEIYYGDDNARALLGLSQCQARWKLAVGMMLLSKLRSETSVHPAHLDSVEAARVKMSCRGQDGSRCMSTATYIWRRISRAGYGPSPLALRQDWIWTAF